MTARRVRIGMAVVLAGSAQVGPSAALQPAAGVLPAESRPRSASTKPVARPAPRVLRDRITELGRTFNGRVGISVRSIDDGWSAGWKDSDYYPQQSVSKLWVCITALDAADRGRIRLADKVTLTRDDLTVFHQPIASLIGRGSYTTTLDELMFKAVTTSDNTANDKVLRLVGGPKAVRAMIAAKGLGAIRFGDGERDLQSRIAGLIWSPAYSTGTAFWDAR
ncbi:MAG: serine hydrolase, partial [Sphingomicrobium sp.]